MLEQSGNKIVRNPASIAAAPTVGVLPEDRPNKQQAAHLVPLAELLHRRWQQRQQLQHCSQQALLCQVPGRGKQLLLQCTAPPLAARVQPLVRVSTVNLILSGTCGSP